MGRQAKERFLLGTSYIRTAAPEPGNVTMRFGGHIMNWFESGEKKSLIEVKYCGHCLTYQAKKSSSLSIETSILQNVDVCKKNVYKTIAASVV